MLTANPILTFVIAALAAWRLSHLIAHEEGPFHLFGRWRALVGGHAVGELFTCFQCLSLWIGAGLALLVGSTWKEIALLTFALSGAACLLNRLGSEPLVLQPLPPAKSEPMGDPDYELLRQSHSGGYGDYEPGYEPAIRRRSSR
ncbi:MAG TPA: hypothetical protein VGK29_10730 [Paludibaculum sp.]|jgi:hypothetical protein